MHAAQTHIGAYVCVQRLNNKHELNESVNRNKQKQQMLFVRGACMQRVNRHCGLCFPSWVCVVYKHLIKAKEHAIHFPNTAQFEQYFYFVSSKFR